jgi:predicted nucleic acid-binding protein
MSAPVSAHVDHFYDSNILLYAVSPNPADARKRGIARGLLSRPVYGLSIQVLQEFYVNVTRSKIAGQQPLMTRPQGQAAIVELLHQHIADNTPLTLLAALSLHQRFSLSYWDAAVIAAAQSLKARTLYSEALQHGQRFDDVRVVNPFLDVA